MFLVVIANIPYIHLAYIVSYVKVSSFHGLIAQRIEHPPSKRVVAGSNPAQSNISYGKSYE
jgi:hypothetical protein